MFQQILSCIRFRARDFVVIAGEKETTKKIHLDDCKNNENFDIEFFMISNVILSVVLFIEYLKRDFTCKHS